MRAPPEGRDGYIARAQQTLSRISNAGVCRLEGGTIHPARKGISKTELRTFRTKYSSAGELRNCVRLSRDCWLPCKPS